MSTNVDGRELTARGAATRARLLEAAERVFAELGDHEASIVKITAAVCGLRVSREETIEGLDFTTHGERGYNP